MTKSLAVILVSLAACSNSSSPAKPDAAVAIDAPPANAMVTVTGVADEIGIAGRTPIAGVTIEVFKEGDATATATATSAADGTYTLTFATGGTAVTGYLHAKKGTTYVDTYLYPAAPIAADLANITVFLLTPSTLSTAQTLVQVSPIAGTGFIAAQVLDSANAVVGGATITSTPAGTVKYNASGLPNKTATATDTDGIGYILNVPAGDVMVSAAKAGSTFHSHSLKARADAVTLTLIQ